MAITIYDTLEQGNVGGKLVKGNDVWVNIDGTEKDLNSAIRDGDIGGGGDVEADNYIGDTDSGKVIRVDTDKQSVAEGRGTTTTNLGEHAEGSFNISHTHASNSSKQTIHSVGIGNAENVRGNAHEIMANGDHYLGHGKVFLREYRAGRESDYDDIGTQLENLASIDKIIYGYNNSTGFQSSNHGESSAELGNTVHNRANGECSIAAGDAVITNNPGEIALGAYNASHGNIKNKDASKDCTQLSVGIGSYSTRKNAHEIMMNGDHYLGDGALYKGCYGASNLQRLDVYTSTKTVTLGGYILRTDLSGYSVAYEYRDRTSDYLTGSETYAFKFGIMNIDGATEVVPQYNNSFIGCQKEINGNKYIIPIEGSGKDIICDLSPYITGSEDQFYYVVPGSEISNTFKVTLGANFTIPTMLHSVEMQVKNCEVKTQVYTRLDGTNNSISINSSTNACDRIFDLRGQDIGNINIRIGDIAGNYKETTIYLDDAYGYEIQGDDYIEINEPPSNEDSGIIISIQSNIIVYGKLPAQE